MKKIVLVMLMLLLCVGYFLAVRSKNEKPVEKYKEGIEVLLKTENDALTTAYPKTPEAVIENHSKIMEYQYSSQMEQGLVDEAVATIRLLYSKTLLDLNPEDQQEFIMVGELLENKENKIHIIKSEIEQVDYNKKKDEATIKVKHYTTKGDKERKYNLILEKGKWKIDGWENIKPEEVSKSTEEEK
ncbi:MAG: hypothetical protein AB9856_11630 [Cellulosilyticaceae bacterium]